MPELSVFPALKLSGYTNLQRYPAPALWLSLCRRSSVQQVTIAGLDAFYRGSQMPAHFRYTKEV